MTGTEVTTQTETTGPNEGTTRPACELSPGLRDEIARQSDFPAATRAVHRLQTLVGNDSCSAASVAQVILQDPALAARVLQTVNSAFYGASSRRVSTITRAVVLLGFETIRDVAASLLVLEHFVRRGASGNRLRAELRESLVRAWLAQSLARRVNPGLAEEAYLLGLFSNLGRLWLASHHPVDFERLVELEDEGTPSAEAGERIFGTSPECVAGAILERGGHPPAFLRYFSEPPPRDVAGLRQQGGTLSALVALAAELPRDGGLDVAPEASSVKTLADLLEIPAADLGPLVERALEASRRHGRFLDLEDDANATPRHPPTHGRRDGVPTPSGIGADSAVEVPLAAEAGGEATTSNATGNSASTHGSAPHPSSDRANVLRAMGIGSEIARALIEHADVGEVATMALEGMVAIAPCDVALLCLATPARDRLVGRIGVGPGLTDDLHHVAVPIAAGAGALAEAAHARAAVLLASEPATKLLPPGSPPLTARLKSALIAPLVVHDRLLGVVLAARTSGPPVCDDTLAMVRFFADLVCVGLAVRAA